MNSTDTTIVVRQIEWHGGGSKAVIHRPVADLQDVAQIPAELQHVFQLVEELLVVSTGAAGVAIALGSSNAMHCVSSIGDAPPVNIPLQLDGTLSGHCVRTGKIVSRRPARRSTDQGSRSVIVAPVFLYGCVVGLIGVFSTQATAFGSAGRAAMRHAARMIELCIAKLEAVPKLASTCDIGWGKPLVLEGSRVNGTPDMTAPSTSPGPTPSREKLRHLLGLPCRVCGTYLYSDEVSCRVCKTPSELPLNSVA